MTRYLLPCSCGQNTAVDVGQAGERVNCPCGAVLEVPPLRKMRHLAVAPSAEAQPAARWNFRKGIVTACVTLAALLGAIALGIWITEPTVPSFTAGRAAAVEQGLQTMTPAQGWHLWIEVYKPLAERGFSEIVHPHTAAIEANIAQRRFLEKTLLSAAGVFVAVAVLAAFWPQGQTGRQGDKEKRRAH